MKKFLSVLVLIGWLTLPGTAQSRPQRPGGPGLQALKIAFITKRLNLTPQEAERFWPIYNQYTAEVRQAYVTYRDRKNELELDEALLNIRKKYSVEFLKALSPEKINEFFRAERDFGGYVQKEAQRRQMQRRFNGPNDDQ
jgi:hypothetical protein